MHRIEKYDFNEYTIPECMRESLRIYIEKGFIPGSFLMAVLENNLVEATSRADYTNIRNLPAYANYLYNYAPADCWGSVETVANWIKNKREERENA